MAGFTPPQHQVRRYPQGLPLPPRDASSWSWPTWAVQAKPPTRICSMYQKTSSARPSSTKDAAVQPPRDAIGYAQNQASAASREPAQGSTLSRMRSAAEPGWCWCGGVLILSPC